MAKERPHLFPPKTTQEFDDTSFVETAKVLLAITPFAKKWFADDVAAFVEHMKRGPNGGETVTPGYWGTLGFYVATCKLPNGNLYSKATVSAYTIAKHLGIDVS